MTEYALEHYIQPYPGIRGFIFAPPATGESRTWIFDADVPPELVLNYHFASLLTQGWRVTEGSPKITAERGDSGVTVSVSSRNDGTRIIYEVTINPKKALS